MSVTVYEEGLQSLLRIPIKKPDPLVNSIVGLSKIVYKTKERPLTEYRLIAQIDVSNNELSIKFIFSQISSLDDEYAAVFSDKGNNYLFEYKNKVTLTTSVNTKIQAWFNRKVNESKKNNELFTLEFETNVELLLNVSSAASEYRLYLLGNEYKIDKTFLDVILDYVIMISMYSKGSSITDEYFDFDDTTGEFTKKVGIVDAGPLNYEDLLNDYVYKGYSSLTKLEVDNNVPLDISQIISRVMGTVSYVTKKKKEPFDISEHVRQRLTSYNTVLGYKNFKPNEKEIVPVLKNEVLKRITDEESKKDLFIKILQQYPLVNSYIDQIRSIVQRYFNDEGVVDSINNLVNAIKQIKGYEKNIEANNMVDRLTKFSKTLV